MEGTEALVALTAVLGIFVGMPWLFLHHITKWKQAKSITIEDEDLLDELHDIARRLDEVDLVWAPVQTPAQVAADPQVAAAGALIDVEDGQGGTYRSPAAPARFPGADATVRPAAPGLGQHTREVLAEIGYAPAEIEAMLASGSAA